MFQVYGYLRYPYIWGIRWQLRNIPYTLNIRWQIGIFLSSIKFIISMKRALFLRDVFGMQGYLPFKRVINVGPYFVILDFPWNFYFILKETHYVASALYNTSMMSIQLKMT